MKLLTSSQTDQPKNLWRTRYGVGLIVLGAVAAFFLFFEHQAHLFGALPFVLILACPLMHLFMHRGHGGHGQHTGADQSQPVADEPRRPNQENGHESR